VRRVLVALLFVLVGCKTSEPSGQPVETCTRSCEARASRQCSSDECVRGCEFILDRIVEREADKVISCVAKAPRRCADVVWAECAASIGPHLDGGPPAPTPPPEDWE
jgi:hypothetical protein